MGKSLCAFASVLMAAAFSASAQVSGGKDAGGNILVVYFSRADENYGTGRITEGNTKIIADMIAGRLGADTFEIKPKRAYPADYRACTEVAKTELQQKARPEIAATTDIGRYDTVFVGYPNWWGDMPMCVYTFLESQDWNGKTVIPFCTHEGSGIGATARRLKEATGADVKEGLAVRGTTAQSRRDEARKAVESFLAESGF